MWFTSLISRLIWVIEKSHFTWCTLQNKYNCCEINLSSRLVKTLCMHFSSTVICNKCLMCCHTAEIRKNIVYVLHSSQFLGYIENIPSLTFVPGCMQRSQEKQNLKTNPYLDSPAGFYCGSFEKYCRFVLLMLAVLQCCILNCWVRFHLPALSSVLTQWGEVSHRVCLCARVRICDLAVRICV